MFHFTKPDRPTIEAFLSSASKDNFSYSEVGRTVGRYGSGGKQPETRSYNIDHNRVIIGQGDEDWQRAKDAVRNWKMFDFQWVQLCWPDTPIKEDQNVAILVSHLGFYSLNAARVVYAFDELYRFGFAYGTLTNHSESGEERFSVEMDKDTGEVWYDLYAFSRPSHVLAKLGYPVSRMMQKRFADDSKEAMKRSLTA